MPTNFDISAAAFAAPAFVASSRAAAASALRRNDASSIVSTLPSASTVRPAIITLSIDAPDSPNTVCVIGLRKGTKFGASRRKNTISAA